MKKTMLTADTLDRFERFVDIATLSPEQIRDIEHSAFAANMGADSDEGAWNWFAHLVEEFQGITLPMFHHVPRR